MENPTPLLINYVYKSSKEIESIVVGGRGHVVLVDGRHIVLVGGCHIVLICGRHIVLICGRHIVLVG